MVTVALEITCVDCGGRCYLLSHAPEEGFVPGDVVAYRCGDCMDRWDVVVDEADDDPADDQPDPRSAARRAARHAARSSARRGRG